MSVSVNSVVLEEKLKQFFGFRTFRSSVQKKATRRVLQGDGDVYVNLEPAAGKSICFQLPALLKPHKLTLVFVTTPFVATNQVSFLKKKGVKAQYLSHRCNKESSDLTIYRGKEDEVNFQFLYVLVQERCLNLISEFIFELNKKNGLSYIVFDEAHSASPLSEDYIPAYQVLAKWMNEKCPDVCKIALTATATAEVRRDLLAKLYIKEKYRLRPSKFRITAYRDVHFVETLPDPGKHLIEFIRKALNLSENQPLDQKTLNAGIIFCSTKKETRSLAKKLKSAEIRAVSVNGDMPLVARLDIFKRWESGEISVLVTTHKFVIGLHDPNVRFVVHWNLPFSMEQLYQETGRISQNGEACYCRIYYSCEEELNIKARIKPTFDKLLPSKPKKPYDVVERRLKNLDDVLGYCLQKTRCRHVAGSQDFFSHLPIKRCEKFCDVCQEPENLKQRVTTFLELRAAMKNKIYTELKNAEKVIEKKKKKRTVPLKTRRRLEIADAQRKRLEREKPMFHPEPIVVDLISSDSSGSETE